MKELFENKTILITGGTGFLGRAIIKEVLKYNPASIRVFSRDEVKHHRLQEQFKYDSRLRNLIGDVRDLERVKRATEGCDIVIHAAALKRLDILEYNVDESIKTNIIGSMNVVLASRSSKVKKVILISTDKACSPVNTYGACKFVSERIFIESNYSKGATKTVFTVVRYGNVLESTGSVIPFFTSKIKNGEDIPLTDDRMTRFIISPKQAVELIFTAIKYGVGGEVFIPRLPAFKIVDLIQILKDKYNANNKIKVIGIRPGEKIHELMINKSEVPRTYPFGKYYVIASHIEKIKDYSRVPEYALNNQPLSEKDITEYSSESAVISREEVARLLHQLEII